MAQYQRKPAVVEAKQHDGDLPLKVMHNHDGELLAQPGDYLVGTEKGEITVVPREKFEAEYDAVEHPKHPESGPGSPGHKAPSEHPFDKKHSGEFQTPPKTVSPVLAEQTPKSVSPVLAPESSHTDEELKKAGVKGGTHQADASKTPAVKKPEPTKAKSNKK